MNNRISYESYNSPKDFAKIDIFPLQVSVSNMTKKLVLLNNAKYQTKYIQKYKDELYLILVPQELWNIHARVVIPARHEVLALLSIQADNLKYEHSYNDLYFDDSYYAWIKDLNRSWMLCNNPFPTQWDKFLVAVHADKMQLFYSDTINAHRRFVWNDFNDSRICVWDINNKIYVSLGDELFIS